MYGVYELSPLFRHPRSGAPAPLGYAVPAAINSASEIVGFSSLNAESVEPFHAVVWKNRVATDLGTLYPGGGSLAWSMNDHGVAVGISYAPDVQTACRWDGTQVTALPLPDGFSGSAALSINNRGDIAGYVYGNMRRGCVWFADGTVSLVGVAPFAALLSGTIGLSDEDFSTTAVAINDNADVVVDASFALVVESVPYLWQNGLWTPLTLGPAPPHRNANAINLWGTVVGNGFSWDQGTGLHVIEGATLRAISQSGQAVGSGTSGAITLQVTGGLAVDLNNAIPGGTAWTLEHATSVNSGGYIVGTGAHNGEPAAYLLDPRGAFHPTPVRRKPPIVWPGDPAPVPPSDALVDRRVLRTLTEAVRGLQGKDREEVEAIIARLRAKLIARNAPR